MTEVVRNADRLDAVRERVLEVFPFELAAHLQARLDEAIAAGRVRPMTLPHLGLTILSLNLAVFTVWPAVARGLRLPPERLARFVRERRAEHVAVVLRSLAP
jgi:hypothetical protein